MAAIRISVDDRIRVVSILEQQHGNLGQLRLLSRIIAKLDLSEQERKDIGYRVRTTPQGNIAEWRLNAPLEPAVVELKSEEADRLRQMLEQHPGFTANDLKWVDALLQQLAGE